MKHDSEQPTLKQCNTLLKEANIIDTSYPLAALVWLPYGCEILRIAESYLDSLFRSFGYGRYLFPSLIAEQEFDRINKNIYPFEGSVYTTTQGALLRPSGESAIYPMFRQWIRSHHDLPLKVFQIGSTFRSGGHRGFLRPNENDFFVEAHAAFSSRDDANAEIIRCNELVSTFMRWLGIACLKTVRPQWTNKPVAEKEYAFDILLPTGEMCLLNVTYAQMQIFSRCFGVSFKNKLGKSEYTYQTEFGFSQRSILTAIWQMSGQDGLFLPSSFSPIQLVIIPVNQGDIGIKTYVESLYKQLSLHGLRVHVDRARGALTRRCKLHEKRGIPVRIEVGTREVDSDIVSIIRHDTREKMHCHRNVILQQLEEVFSKIMEDVFLRSELTLNKNIIPCTRIVDLQGCIADGKVGRLCLCASYACVSNVEKNVGVGEVIGFDLDEKNLKRHGYCMHCCVSTPDVAYYSRRV